MRNKVNGWLVRILEILGAEVERRGEKRHSRLMKRMCSYTSLVSTSC